MIQSVDEIRHIMHLASMECDSVKDTKESLQMLGIHFVALRGVLEGVMSYDINDDGVLTYEELLSEEIDGGMSSFENDTGSFLSEFNKRFTLNKEEDNDG